jgi:hypothetical protein
MAYEFGVIVASFPKNDDECLEIADKLGAAGCLDASVSGHIDGTEAIFVREAESLDRAIQSAVASVESAGLRVIRVELARESIA